MTNFNLSEWALNHRQLVIYFMVAFSLAGMLAYVGLGRDEDPSFTIKTMVVRVLWPGATTDETVRQVTDRVEKVLQQTPQLDYLRSYTKPGDALIYVNLKGTAPASQVPDIWYQVRKKVGDALHTMPRGIVGPFYNDEFGDTFAIIYAFTSDGFTPRELRDHVEDVRSRLLTVANVAKAELVGVQDEAVYISFSPQRLAAMGLDRESVVAALQNQNAVVPAGVIDAGAEKVYLRVSGRFRSAKEIAALNLRVGDRFVHVADIADVERRTTDPQKPEFRYNGQPALGIALSMTKGANMLDLGESVEHAMEEIKRELPVGIEAHLVADQPEVVVEAVGGFTKALVEAVLIVLAVSFVSLGMRAGFVVALSIPLVLTMTFLCMSLFGIDLQRVSLGALIIALGLLVDDAMITVEMMITKLEEGFDKIRAATFAYTATAFPMLTGTLITAAGFVPVGFAQSAAGEYVISLFQVITIALMISWVVAVIFSPYLGVLLLKAKPQNHAHGETRLGRSMREAIVWCLRNRWRVIGGTLAVFVLSLFSMSFVERQFFPSSDRPELLLNLTLPQTATISATAKDVSRIEAVLKSEPDIHHWSFYVGQGAVRFYLPLDMQLANDNFAQAVIVTKGMEERERVREKLEKILERDFPNVIARVSALEQGPAVGWPVQYRISGNDNADVHDIAAKLAAILAKDPRAKSVNFDWNEMTRVVRLEIDQDKSRLLGLNSEAIASSLEAVFAGRTLTQLRDNTYLVDVVARGEDSDRRSLETLRNLSIPIPNGTTIRLDQVASFGYGLEYPLVWRRNRLPTVTVQSDIVPGVEAATLVDALAPEIEKLRATLKPGYSIEVAGTVEESAKGSAAVTAVIPTMIFIVITLLMIQLQSFSRVFLVVSVAPLGLIGVAAIMLASHTPMGFIATLGVIALMGMIIRNSLILVTQIDENIAAGHDPWSAIVEATLHRVRPILLTAAAAILGMVPIAGEVFWGPMAYAVMGGLAVATLLTLLFLPALYAAWFRVREPESPAAVDVPAHTLGVAAGGAQ